MVLGLVAESGLHGIRIRIEVVTIAIDSTYGHYLDTLYILGGIFLPY